MSITAGSGGDVHGVLNMPLGDKTALRVSGFYDGVPGYIDDPKRGATDLNDGHKYGGRASLLFQPADSTVDPPDRRYAEARTTTAPMPWTSIQSRCSRCMAI